MEMAKIAWPARSGRRTEERKERIKIAKKKKRRRKIRPKAEKLVSPSRSRTAGYPQKWAS
jgi:hypothetical protein